MEGTEKIKRDNLSYLVMERLRESLRKGEYGPGQTLPPIKELARKFGVSTASVREAIRSMEVAGLLKVKQGFGVIVGDGGGSFDESLMTLMTLQKVKLRMIHETRLVLELGLVPFVIERIGDREIEELERHLNTMRNATEVYEIVSADISFHVCMARASRNHILAEMVRSVLSALSFDKTFATGLIEYRNAAVSGHQKMIEVVKSRDRVGLYETLKAHLEMGLTAHHSVLEEESEGSWNGFHSKRG